MCVCVCVCAYVGLIKDVSLHRWKKWSRYVRDDSFAMRGQDFVVHTLKEVKAVTTL